MRWKLSGGGGVLVRRWGWYESQTEEGGERKRRTNSQKLGDESVQNFQLLLHSGGSVAQRR